MKIRIKVGDVEVDYDGAEAFLTKKLPELVGRLRPTGSRQAPGTGGDQKPGGHTAKHQATNGSLAGYLIATKAKQNQVRKFLATAAWLQQKGNERVSTADVTKALKVARQGKLTNPADCLNKNVGKGHCEKDGKQFYVLEDGYELLK